MKIKKGDTVQLLLGKDRGKTGKVLRVLPKEDKAFVEGVNLYKRSLRADALKRHGESKGQIVEIAKPVNISNVALICQNCKKITRVGFKLEGNEKLRICKKCKEVLK